MKPGNSDEYFWRDPLVMLRAIEPQDWEYDFHNRFHTPGRRLVNYEVELPPTDAEAKAFCEKFANFDQSAGRIMFTILTHDDQVVGGLNLNSIDERNGTFSIGIQVDCEQRGKGYGTAAMRILLRYAFFERRLHKFNTSVIEGNIGSATMMRKLGCKEEGRRRQVIYMEGRYWDEILFGLTGEEFAANERAIVEASALPGTVK